MISCPNCNVADNEAQRTWSVIFEDIEVQMRKRYCKACGCKFITHEFAFTEYIDINSIIIILDKALKLYPQKIIKPYKNN